MDFGVRGSYVALRRLINLLELSDSFLMLEEINLSGRGSEELQITLRLSTLFSTRPAAARPAAEAKGAVRCVWRREAP